MVRTPRPGIRHTLGAVLFTAFVLGGVTAAEARSRVYVRIGPPAPIVEVRPVPPRDGYVWVPGYYGWNHGDYRWLPGHWAKPPRRHAVSTEPRRVHEQHGWYMVPGRWR